MKTEKIKRITFSVADGLLRGSTNILLYWIYLEGALIGKSYTSQGVYQASRQADEVLRRLNYDTFKQALSKMRKQKVLTQSRKRMFEDIQITQAGRKRLQSLLPQYQTVRPWSGYFYLISYDIAETHHHDRDLLRRYLRRIGCGLLQESLWLTPYNPADLLNEFSDEHHIHGTILVSRLGKDGTIGQESISSLLNRIYHLDELNTRYQGVVDQANHKTNFQIGIEYLSILQDDPQLPFSLLPSNWQGDRAYKLYLSIVNK